MRLRPGTPGYRPRSRRHLGRRRPRPRISRSWSSGRVSGLRCRGLGNLRGHREESRHLQPPQNHRGSSWQPICKREIRYFQWSFWQKKIRMFLCWYNPSGLYLCHIQMQFTSLLLHIHGESRAQYHGSSSSVLYKLLHHYVIIA